MAPKALREFRQKMGMIFQHFNLLSSRTVGGNVSYPLEIYGHPLSFREERIDEVLGLVGLSAKKNIYPAHLSGGQKQRVGIARALASHPQVLLCDEATSALDPQTTRDILKLLKTLNTTLGLTIILITHEMDVVKEICNKVAVLDKGRVVEQGSVSEIFADPKTPTTKQFLQNTIHEVPPALLHAPTSRRKLLRLSFKGKEAAEPVISRMIRQFDVDVNILLGWLDSIEGLLIGNLVIDIEGEEERVTRALHYLEEKRVHYEVLKP